MERTSKRISKSFIETRNLSYNVNGKAILSDINLRLNKGKLVGIIGPNGAGKSTFMKLITNVLKPSIGAIYLDNENISHYPIKELNKKIAYLPQNVTFNFPFKVLEIVLMGRYPYLGRLQNENKSDNKIALKSLELVNMEKFKDRNILTLSGGEQQRVSLAKIITQQTDFLFLDEPISNLDINHQLIVMELLKSLASEGKGTYVVLHDIRLANKYCDKIIIFNEGKIAYKGIPNVILNEQIISSVFKVKSEIKTDSLGNIKIDFLGAVDTN